MYVLYSESTLKVKKLLLATTGLTPDKGYSAQKLHRLLESQLSHESLCGSVESLANKGRYPSKPNHKFKTEKCRQFDEMGYCEYGSRCMFAHGLHELKPEVNRHPNYKTRICTTFQFDGYCSFGSRCAFVHNSGDPIELLMESVSRCPRLPMPENLTKSRPEFYPSDILTRKKSLEMLKEEQLLPSFFVSDHSTRLSTFVRLTNNK